MTDILVSSSKDSVLVTSKESIFVTLGTESTSSVIVSGLMGPSGPRGTQVLLKVQLHYILIT